MQQTKITSREFSCTRDGLTIRGQFFLPAAGHDERCPAVIISHGFMANAKSVRQYAEQFARWGYAAFTFDFNGGCLLGRSDGKTTDMSVFTEVADLKAVIAHVQGQPFVDRARLALMGCSQGGFVSAITAAELAGEIARLILFYPALCIPDDARRGRMMWARFDPAHIPETVRCGPMKLGRVYPASVLTVDPLELIAGYAGPVYLVHGSADPVVSLDYSVKASQRYADCSLMVLDGAGHGFRGQKDRLALEGVRLFLEGYQEIFAVDVMLEGFHKRRVGKELHVSIPFSGTVSGKYYQGAVLPGASDEQVYWSRKKFRLCASYSLEGTDIAGQACRIDIVNRNNGSGWQPEVSTDSTALGFINSSPAAEVFEGRKQGPVVHFYSHVR